jgi:hypothetical protein
MDRIASRVDFHALELYSFAFCFTFADFLVACSEQKLLANIFVP